jgi:hypothetical protein
MVCEIAARDPIPGDGSDVTAAVKSAVQWARERIDNGGFVKFIWPGGGFRLTEPVPLNVPNLHHEGQGKDLTTIISTFGGCPLPLGAHDGAPVDNVSVRRMSFAVDTTHNPPPGYGLEIDAASRAIYDDIRLYSFAHLGRIGRADLALNTPAGVALHDVEGGAQGGRGVDIYSASGVLIAGQTTIDSVGGTTGLSILGGADGVIVERTVTLDNFSIPVRIAPPPPAAGTSTSIASIELYCSLTNAAEAFIDIDLPAHTYLNMLLAKGVRAYGNRSVPKNFIRASGLGSIGRLALHDIEADGLRRTFGDVNIVCESLSVLNTLSRWGAQDGDALFDAWDLHGLAHGEVVFANNSFKGLNGNRYRNGLRGSWAAGWRQVEATRFEAAYPGGWDNCRDWFAYFCPEGV